MSFNFRGDVRNYVPYNLNLGKWGRIKYSLPLSNFRVMRNFKCSSIPYTSLLEVSGLNTKVYPYLRDEDGVENMWNIGPLHGRSFVVGRHDDGRYVVSKGNGLCYSKHTFLYTQEMATDVWGLLLKEDAFRDFNCCLDIQALGIKTNQMECIVELEVPLHIEQTNVDIKPILLQYNVECPYRICDAAFMDKSQIEYEVKKWETLNVWGYDQHYLIAAEVLINNLQVMHSHQVLHNAIHEQNYTWALELLDFELARTPQHPYSKADYERHVGMLCEREIIQTYIIINYIANVLREEIDFKVVDDIFKRHQVDIDKYVL